MLPSLFRRVAGPSSKKPASAAWMAGTLHPAGPTRCGFWSHGASVIVPCCKARGGLRRERSVHGGVHVWVALGPRTPHICPPISQHPGAGTVKAGRGSSLGRQATDVLGL